MKPTGRAFIWIGSLVDTFKSYLSATGDDFSVHKVFAWRIGPCSLELILYCEGAEATPLNCAGLQKELSPEFIVDGEFSRENGLTRSEAAESLIRFGSREGDLVFDPFATEGYLVTKVALEFGCILTAFRPDATASEQEVAEKLVWAAVEQEYDTHIRDFL